MIHRIGVLTSGDDAPGKNAAVRAVTRIALGYGWEVSGIRHGFKGLINGETIPLTARSVGGIIQQGGSILGSLNSAEFQTEGGQRKAIGVLESLGIDALVVIGGDGSQAGARELARMGVPVNGVAATVENDLYISDLSVGVDTALNVAADTIDRLKIMTSPECYTLVVEVAGRKCGSLAQLAGIVSGAEAVVTPETETTPEEILGAVETARESGKSHAIIIVAEGAQVGADTLQRLLCQCKSLDLAPQTMALGQIQRGSGACAQDRLLGTRLGALAVDALARGEAGVLAGISRGEVCTIPLNEVPGFSKAFGPELVRLAAALAI